MLRQKHERLQTVLADDRAAVDRECQELRQATEHDCQVMRMEVTTECEAMQKQALDACKSMRRATEQEHAKMSTERQRLMVPYQRPALKPLLCVSNKTAPRVGCQGVFKARVGAD